MLDQDAALLALRNRMLALVVCTTGAQSLSATATGYARAAGSFLDDGFRDGMEFLAAGFGTAGNNGRRVIESVDATTITTTTTLAFPTVEAAAGGRTLSVGLPIGRSLDNKGYTPAPGRPYIEEDFVPGGHGLRSFPAQGGTSQEDGLYVVKWYGLAGKGSSGIRRPVQALMALFAPGTVLSANGVSLRMGDFNDAVKSGQIIPQGNGWSVCIVTIPWWALSINTVAA